MLDGLIGAVGPDGVGCVGGAGRPVAGTVGVAGRSGAGVADDVGGVDGRDDAIVGPPGAVDVVAAGAEAGADATFGASSASSAACITSWRLSFRPDTVLMSNSGGAAGVGANSGAVSAGPASVSSAVIQRSKF